MAKEKKEKASKLNSENKEAKKGKVVLGERSLAEVCLPFERPVIELEKKIEELKSTSGQDIDLSGEVLSAEKNWKRLSKIFLIISLRGSVFKLRVILCAPTLWTMLDI